MTSHLPSAEVQLAFLKNIQRLLEEGAFSSTYKYALLLILADMCVEKVSSDTQVLRIDTKEIAEKYIEYYWPQAMPYPATHNESGVLKQNSGRQAKIVNLVAACRIQYGGSLFKTKNDKGKWTSLINNVAATVREQPLWRLQLMGGTVNDFLYPHTDNRNEIKLNATTIHCFRAFYGYIQNLVRGAWIRELRKYRGNKYLLGESVELGEFLFGNERSDLSTYVPLLNELQNSSCFYCNGAISGRGQVDHFIPWVKYPHDMGHNFVLAHISCNNNKRDYLAADNHLAKWSSRNHEHSSEMCDYFAEYNLYHNLNTTNQIAYWAYEQTEISNGHVWLSKGDPVIDLSPSWRDKFYGLRLYT